MASGEVYFTRGDGDQEQHPAQTKNKRKKAIPTYTNDEIELANTNDDLRGPNDFDEKRVIRSEPGTYDYLEDAGTPSESGNRHSPHSCFLTFLIGYGICTTITTVTLAIMLVTKTDCNMYPPMATSSSTTDNQEPRFAIDGDVTTSVQHLFRSKSEFYPWLMIDLGESKAITKIKFVSPGKKLSSFLRGQDGKKLEIRVGDEKIVEVGQPIEVNDLCGSASLTALPNKEMDINCNGSVSGQFLTMQIIDPNELSILKVNEVFWYTAEKVAEKPLIEIPIKGNERLFL